MRACIAVLFLVVPDLFVLLKFFRVFLRRSHHYHFYRRSLDPFATTLSRTNKTNEYSIVSAHFSSWIH